MSTPTPNPPVLSAKRFTVLFWKRLAEQVGVTGAGAFVATLTANAGENMSRALILSAAAAAVRAAYGVVTQHIGADVQQPSVK